MNNKPIAILNKLAKQLYKTNRDDMGDYVSNMITKVASIKEESDVTVKSASFKNYDSIKIYSSKGKEITKKANQLTDIFSAALESNDKIPFGRNKRGK